MRSYRDLNDFGVCSIKFLKGSIVTSDITAYTLDAMMSLGKKVLNLLKKGLLKVEAILKSAWTEKDQIDNFLKERRLMRSLESSLVGDCTGALRIFTKDHMILSYDVLIIQNIRVISFTMKMEILLEPTSNKLMVGDLCDSIRIKLVTTGKKRWCDSIRIKLVPERFYTSARNPVKEILLKLNLPDHRILKDGGEDFRFSNTKRPSRSDEVLKVKNFKKDAALKLSKSTNQEWFSMSSKI
ncbi:hypothetical protein Tco_0778646 [Tanacetum coccineum]